MRTISANSGCSQRAKGGLKKIYLISTAKVKSIDYDSSKASYYNIVIASGAAFIGYSFDEGAAVFEEKTVVKKGSRSVSQTITFSLSGQPAQTLKSLNEIVGTGSELMAIVVDANNTARVVGYSNLMGFERPLKIDSMQGSSQLELENLPDENIVLTTISPSKAGVLLDDVYLASR